LWDNIDDVENNGDNKVDVDNNEDDENNDDDDTMRKVRTGYHA